MFDQLKRRVAIRQGVTLGLLLVVLLGALFGYNVLALVLQLSRKSAELINDPAQYFFAGEETDRDTLYVLVRGNEPRSYTTAGYYDEKTMEYVISYALENPTDRGQIKIGGRRAVYAVTREGADVYIGIYDYTRDYVGLKRTALLVSIVVALGLACIAFYSINSAKNQVAPVERAFQKQQELVANASHELKTPLTVINADLEILRSYQEEMPAEHVKWVEGIAEQTNRMKRMVEEMLELAKMESEGREAVKTPLDLSEVTEGVVLGTEALAFEHEVAMKVNIEKEQYILGNAPHIEKLAYILVENALKYTSSGGTVEIAVRSDRKKVVLSVKNTGEGIAKEDIPKLFDRFYRTDASHHTADGFGLGLAIAKSIADAHEATIDVESEVGEYTLFSVTFAKANKK